MFRISPLAVVVFDLIYEISFVSSSRLKWSTFYLLLCFIVEKVLAMLKAIALVQKKNAMKV